MGDLRNIILLICYSISFISGFVVRIPKYFRSKPERIDVFFWSVSWAVNAVLFGLSIASVIHGVHDITEMTALQELALHVFLITVVQDWSFALGSGRTNLTDPVYVPFLAPGEIFALPSNKTFFIFHVFCHSRSSVVPGSQICCSSH